ncbi:MAG: 30S ribosomal protein S12 methylthiotransferase RimO [Desulfosalsimonadaceae bacterium]
MHSLTNVYINTLGCARNLVDSEIMAAALRRCGCCLTENPAEAGAIVVNTCSFITDAVNESIDTILELAGYKKEGVCRRLIVAGCLPQRFGPAIAGALPEVDVFLGTGAFDQIVPAVAGEFAHGSCILPEPAALSLPTHQSGRKPSTYPVAYLKIGEGCNRRCTYCIIPKLRGRLRSRAAADIMAEAEMLFAEGIKEIVLIAQDTSAYGQDLKGGENLSGLLRGLARRAAETGECRLRFLYGSPDHTSRELIRTVAEHPNIVPYFDLPVQHVSSRLLRCMGRSYRRRDLLSLFADIRRTMPAAALRTTLLVGFPGETEADFMELLDFIKEVEFDHVGVFAYSDAGDLASHNLPGHVPEEIAAERCEQLMTLQARISHKKNQNRVGEVFSTLVEDFIDSELYIGRTQFQAPEVDGVTYIESPDPAIGDFVATSISEAYAYDLKGEPLWPA